MNSSTEKLFKLRFVCMEWKNPSKYVGVSNASDRRNIKKNPTEQRTTEFCVFVGWLERTSVRLSDYELRYLNTKVNDDCVDTQPPPNRIIFPNFYDKAIDSAKHTLFRRESESEREHPWTMNYDAEAATAVGADGAASFWSFINGMQESEKNPKRTTFSISEFLFFFVVQSSWGQNRLFFSFGDKKKKTKEKKQKSVEIHSRFLCLRCGILPHTIFRLCNNLSEAFSVVK